MFHIRAIRLHISYPSPNCMKFVYVNLISSHRDDNYAACIDKYFEQLSQLGRVDSPRFRIIVHDLRTLLERFAYDQSFSADSLGGGRASNVNLIPFMVQLGLFVLDKKGAGQRAAYTRTFQTFVEEDKSAWARSNALVYRPCILDVVFKKDVFLYGYRIFVLTFLC